MSAINGFRALAEFKCLSDEFIGSETNGVIVSNRDDHDFVGTVEARQFLDSSLYGRWRTDNRASRAGDPVRIGPSFGQEAKSLVDGWYRDQFSLIQ
jgi:hypothetical protein